VKTTRIAPGIYSLTIDGTDYWVEGINGPSVWLVHDQTADEYWLGYFRTKRAAVEAIQAFEMEQAA
jgi:hypothetical protein